MINNKKEIIKFDLYVRLYIISLFKDISSAIELKIISICLILSKIYSYTKNQTYPRPNHPLKSKQKSAYFTLISVIISLRTTLENEQVATTNFLNKFNDIDDVLKSEKNEISKLIECAGMQHKKAKQILLVSKYIKNNFNDTSLSDLKSFSVDKAKKIILQIPNIGNKTADCLLELGLDMPSIVIDTNVLRVVLRIFNFSWVEKINISLKEQILTIKYFLENNLKKDVFLFQIVYTLFLLHGKNFCNSKIHCNSCILTKYCKFYKNNIGKHNAKQYTNSN